MKYDMWSKLVFSSSLFFISFSGATQEKTPDIYYSAMNPMVTTDYGPLAFFGEFELDWSGKSPGEMYSYFEKLEKNKKFFRNRILNSQSVSERSFIHSLDFNSGEIKSDKIENLGSFYVHGEMPEDEMESNNSYVKRPYLTTGFLIDKLNKDTVGTSTSYKATGVYYLSYENYNPFNKGELKSEQLIDVDYDQISKEFKDLTQQGKVTSSKQLKKGPLEVFQVTINTEAKKGRASYLHRLLVKVNGQVLMDKNSDDEIFSTNIKISFGKAFKSGYYLMFIDGMTNESCGDFYFLKLNDKGFENINEFTAPCGKRTC